MPYLIVNPEDRFSYKCQGQYDVAFNRVIIPCIKKIMHLFTIYAN